MTWTDTKSIGSTLTAVEYNNLANHVRPTATATVAKSEPADYVTTNYGSDDACIQAAIDYVDGLGGGSVLIREGTYLIETNIQLKTLVSIYGVGYKTILEEAGATYILQATNKNSFSISDLKIEMNNDINAHSAIRLDTATCSDITIFKVKISNCAETVGTCVGIGISNSKDIKIIACIFDTCHNYAVATNNAERLLIEGCHVYGAIGVLAYNAGTKDSHMVGNIVKTVDGASIGIKLNVAENCIVSNNILTSLTKTNSTGISVGDTGCNDNVVNENNVSGYTHGIHLNVHPHRTQVHNNTVVDCTTGVLCSSGAEYSSFVGNQIDSCTTGMDISVYYGVCIGNNISNVTTGIILDSITRYSIISNNTLTYTVTTSLTNNSAQPNLQIINNPGYNPVGAVGPPSVPATTVNYTNAYGYPCTVVVSGGTVTEIDIDDVATGLTSGVMPTIPPGGTINITYSAAPSWLWWGL